MKNCSDSISQKTPASHYALVGFYGLGGAKAGDNPYRQELVSKAGRRIFHFWQKHGALSYLSQEAAKKGWVLGEEHSKPPSVSPPARL